MQVWVDAFGPPDRKGIWLSLLLLCPPIGVLLGFGLTGIMVDILDWRWAFYFQVILFIPCFIVFIIVPNDYFSIHEASKDTKRLKKEKTIKKMVSGGETGAQPVD